MQVKFCIKLNTNEKDAGLAQNMAVHLLPLNPHTVEGKRYEMVTSSLHISISCLLLPEPKPLPLPPLPWRLGVKLPHPPKCTYTGPVEPVWLVRPKPDHYLARIR